MTSQVDKNRHYRAVDVPVFSILNWLGLSPGMTNLKAMTAAMAAIERETAA
jgi:hypothetical protein